MSENWIFFLRPQKSPLIHIKAGFESSKLYLRSCFPFISIRVHVFKRWLLSYSMHGLLNAIFQGKGRPLFSVERVGG